MKGNIYLFIYRDKEFVNIVTKESFELILFPFSPSFFPFFARPLWTSLHSSTARGRLSSSSGHSSATCVHEGQERRGTEGRLYFAYIMWCQMSVYLMFLTCLSTGGHRGLYCMWILPSKKIPIDCFGVGISFVHHGARSLSSFLSVTAYNWPGPAITQCGRRGLL